MSKVVKWRGQFADIALTQYTVEIYGDGTTGVTGNNITLGENPLKTETNTNDDKYGPIWKQTGTLEVVDLDGTLMEEMMPSDAMDHPVVVSSGGSVVWQGFMSCEAYDQAYTSRANTIQFSLIGMIEALNNVTVSVPTSDHVSLMELVNLYKSQIPVLNIQVAHHSELVGSIFYESYVCVQTASMVEKVEDCKSSGVIDVKYLCKKFEDVMTDLCKLLQLSVHEEGRKLYITKKSDRTETVNMSALSYTRGTNHTKYTAAPAKNVKISQKVELLSLGVEIPDVPTYPDMQAIDTSGYYCQTPNRFLQQNTQNTYSNIEMKRVQVNSGRNQDMSYIDEWSPISEIMGYNSGSRSRAYFADRTGCMYAGAEFVKNWMSDKETGSNPKGTDGIYATFYSASTAWFDRYTDIANAPYILKMKNSTPFRFDKGYIKVNIGLNPVGFTKKDADSTTWYTKGDIDNFKTYSIDLIVKVGNKYYSSTDGWTTTPSVISHDVTSDSEEIFLAVPSGGLNGEPEVRVMPILTHNRADGLAMVCELMIKDLSMEYISSDWRDKDDDNNYYGEACQNAKDEIELSLDYATDRGNVGSTCLLVNNAGNRIRTINGTRPEDSLLSDMVAFYSVPRRKIELEVKPISNMAKTLITGYDNRTYLPLAESRDWRMDKSTVTMFETT